MLQMMTGAVRAPTLRLSGARFPARLQPALHAWSPSTPQDSTLSARPHPQEEHRRDLCVCRTSQSRARGRRRAAPHSAACEPAAITAPRVAAAATAPHNAARGQRRGAPRRKRRPNACGIGEDGCKLCAPVKGNWVRTANGGATEEQEGGEARSGGRRAWYVMRSMCAVLFLSAG
jgi:hypothetical protein